MKVVELLSSPELVLRQKAVLAARELLATGDNGAQIFLAGAVGPLVAALRDDDALVRTRAADTLAAAAGSPVGLVGITKLLEAGAAAALLAALDDPVGEVKDAAYGALIACAKRSMPLQATIVAQGALPVLVTKAGLEAAAEKPLRMAAALELVRAILVGRNPSGAPQLIAANAVPALTAMLALWPGPPLTAERATAKEGAAAVLHLMCHEDAGKEAAVAAGAVPLLYDLMLLDRRSARAAASGALMAITVADAGKKAFELAAADGMAALVGLVQREAAGEEDVMINLMQVRGGSCVFRKEGVKINRVNAWLGVGVGGVYTLGGGDCL